MALPEHPRRPQHRRPDPRHFLHPRPGEERKGSRQGARREIHAAAQPVGQRIAHVGGRHAVRLVEPPFEGEDHQHARDVPRDLPDAVRAPGPDAGPDEISDRDLQLAEPPCQAEVEVGAVDQERGARPPFAGGVAGRIHRLQDAGQRRDHLGHAHHRDLLRADQRLESLGAHPRPAGAEGAQVRPQRLQLAQHGGAMQVGRRFQRDHQQLGRIQGTCSKSSRGPSFSSASRTSPTRVSTSCGGWPRDRITTRTSCGRAYG